MFPFLYLGRGHPRIHAPRLEIASSHRCQPKDGAFSDVDTRHHDGARTYPGVGAEGRSIGNKWKCGIIEIMGCAAEKRPLGDNGMRTEMHGRRVIDLGGVSGRDLIGAVKVPWGPNL